MYDSSWSDAATLGEDEENDFKPQKVLDANDNDTFRQLLLDKEAILKTIKSRSNLSTFGCDGLCNSDCHISRSIQILNGRGHVLWSERLGSQLTGFIHQEEMEVSTYNACANDKSHSQSVCTLGWWNLTIRASEISSRHRMMLNWFSVMLKLIRIPLSLELSWRITVQSLIKNYSQIFTFSFTLYLCILSSFFIENIKFAFFRHRAV